MLRKDKLRTDAEFFNEVYSEAEEIFVAFADDDFPYCLPFNFACENNAIYIHCALKGKKLECIEKNPNIAFALACGIKVDTKKSTTWYKSVCGRGKAKILDNDHEKQHALDLIGTRYKANCKRPAPLEVARRINIIKIEILSQTGKNSAPKPLTRMQNHLNTLQDD